MQLKPARIALLTAAIVALMSVAAVRARAARRDAALMRADIETVLADPTLRATAIDEGGRLFAAHCASCHGEAAKGDPRLGVPDLTDGETLYDLTSVASIEAIVRFGIRSRDRRGWDLAAMPGYARAVPYAREPLPSLSPRQVEDLTQSVLWFTGRATDVDAARRGRALFQGSAGCWDCHGRDAGGDAAIGAPALSDAVFLFGGDHDAIFRSIAAGRAGYSPAFERVLDPVAIREVALYVATLAEPPATTRQGHDG